MLGLHFCARAFSSCGKRGPLFIAVRRPLTVAASLVVEHRLQTRRLSNRGSRAQLLRGMWDLPRPGLEPVFPALAGRFSTTAPPGKPSIFRFWIQTFSKLWIHISNYNHTTSSSSRSKLNNLLPQEAWSPPSLHTHSVSCWKVAFSTGRLRLENWESFRDIYLPCPHLQLILNKWLLDESPQTF